MLLIEKVGQKVEHPSLIPELDSQLPTAQPGHSVLVPQPFTVFRTEKYLCREFSSLH